MALTALGKRHHAGKSTTHGRSEAALEVLIINPRFKKQETGKERKAGDRSSALASNGPEEYININMHVCNG